MGDNSFIINCLKKEGQPQVSPADGVFHDLLGPVMMITQSAVQIFAGVEIPVATFV